jgi:hypothetical protein
LISANGVRLCSNLALVSVCDALLDWVKHPQDQDLIDRVMKALKVHWDFCDDE